MDCENCRLKNLCKYTEAFSSLVENVHKVACDDNLENVVDVVVKCKFFEQDTPTAKFTVTNSKVAKESIDEYLKMKDEKPYIQYVDGKQVNRTHSEDSILYNASQNMAKFVQENMSENKKSTLMNTVKNAATNIKESFKDTMNDMHQYSEEK
jgi:hypothetical protein